MLRALASQSTQQSGTPPCAGIPTVNVAKIFEDYTSYSGGQDRAGGGLGLAICRMILQQHRGRVWAESHTAGALFSFVLPVSTDRYARRRSAEGLCKSLSGRN